jgi:hypothetical protein
LNSPLHNTSPASATIGSEINQVKDRISSECLVISRFVVLCDPGNYTMSGSLGSYILPSSQEARNMKLGDV